MLGAVVYYDLANGDKFSGIYLGYNQIAYFSEQDSKAYTISPQDFVTRVARGGSIIYTLSVEDKKYYPDTLEGTALNARQYSYKTLTGINRHAFIVGCITGKMLQGEVSFSKLENVISKEIFAGMGLFSKKFEWVRWDFDGVVKNNTY